MKFRLGLLRYPSWSFWWAESPTSRSSILRKAQTQETSTSTWISPVVGIIATCHLLYDAVVLVRLIKATQCRDTSGIKSVSGSLNKNIFLRRIFINKHSFRSNRNSVRISYLGFSLIALPIVIQSTAIQMYWV